MASLPPAGLFGLSGPRDFLRLAEENFHELEAAPDLRRVVNCIMLVNHLGDWVWHSWLKNQPLRWGELVGSSATLALTEQNSRDWFEGRCPSAKVLREVANGVKHLRTPPGLTASSEPRVVFGALFLHHETVWSTTSGDIYWRGASRGTALADALSFWTAFVSERPTW